MAPTVSTLAVGAGRNRCVPAAQETVANDGSGSIPLKKSTRPGDIALVPKDDLIDRSRIDDRERSKG